MSDLDQKAKDRIAQLEQELDFWRNYLAMSDQARALLSVPVMAVSKPSTNPKKDSEPVDEDTSNAGKQAKPRAVNPPSDVIVDAAIHALRNRGHPLSRRELHRALAERGVVVQGADPVKTLGTILWRASDKIIQLEGYGYWPKHMSYPRASYFRPQEAPSSAPLF